MRKEKRSSEQRPVKLENAYFNGIIGMIAGIVSSVLLRKSYVPVGRTIICSLLICFIVGIGLDFLNDKINGRKVGIGNILVLLLLIAGLVFALAVK